MEIKGFIGNLIRGFYLTSLISCILCLAKSVSNFSINWIICLVPLLISIMILMSIAQLSISTNTAKLELKIYNILQYTLYSFSTSIIAFIILVSLKLDNSLSIIWGLVFLPLWLSTLIFLCFFVFIAPGMLDPTINLNREAYTTILFIISFIVFSVLLCICLSSNNIEYMWVSLLSLIVFTSGAICGKLYYNIYLKELSLVSVLDIEMAIYLSLLPFCITVSIYNADKSIVPVYVPYIFIFAAIFSTWVLSEIENRAEKTLEPKTKNYETLD